MSNRYCTEIGPAPCMSLAFGRSRPTHQGQTCVVEVRSHWKGWFRIRPIEPHGEGGCQGVPTHVPPLSDPSLLLVFCRDEIQGTRSPRSRPCHVTRWTVVASLVRWPRIHGVEASPSNHIGEHPNDPLRTTVPSRPKSESRANVSRGSWTFPPKWDHVIDPQEENGRRRTVQGASRGEEPATWRTWNVPAARGGKNELGCHCATCFYVQQMQISNFNDKGHTSMVLKIEVDGSFRRPSRIFVHRKLCPVACTTDRLHGTRFG